MTFKHILIPTDGSELSLRAINAGVSLASEGQAKVTGLYVDDSSATYTIESNPRDYGRKLDEARSLAKQYLAQVEMAASAAGVDCDICYESQTMSVPDAIASLVREKGCDLVVMGTHGRRGLAAIFNPSNATAVARRVVVPVMMVH